MPSTTELREGSEGSDSRGGSVADGWRPRVGSPGTSDSPSAALLAAIAVVGDICGVSAGDRSVTFFSGLPSIRVWSVFGGGGARFDSCCSAAVDAGATSAVESEGACGGASLIS